MAYSKLVQFVGLQSQEDELIPRRQTESVFYEFVDERSQEDPELTFYERTVLHNLASTCIRESREVQGQVIKT